MYGKIQDQLQQELADIKEAGLYKEERIITSVSIEATTDTNNPIEYSLIAGELPRGMTISGNVIKGSPAEVTKFTEYRFVIRADDSDKEKDRTFKRLNG